MSDDPGLGDGRLNDGGHVGGGSGMYGFSHADAELRAIDAQRPLRHQSAADRAAERLPRLVGAVILILALTWVVRIFWPA